MTGSFDILMVGIGGQGIILASNILGEACLIEGRSVRGAETHGMAQRGGSVEGHIRVDGKYGPLIAPGTAHLMIAFDMLEALRYSHYLAPDGHMVVNSHIVIPTSVFMQGAVVPEKDAVRERLKSHSLCLVDADALATEAGSPLSQNVVMIGAASWFMPFAPESLSGAVERLVPKKTVEINRRAFDLGRAAGERCRQGSIDA
ncbi:MAG: Indolepyruvate oxidoreductase subunit IorB [Methanoregulaceae archaeon PtaB.Bin056]|jgi:indolepyruvate ferredoxin oxidoreductase beta subunit|nr:MAG: Indolepyruvate oxidoreductase subunit IorB [Methanoregulaceae archaeon PtaB.Bin056]